MVLQDYVIVSGHDVNFQNFVLFFNKSVPPDLQDFITVVLGITKIGDHGSYLGLPCLIGRSKKQIFNFVKDEI